MKTTLLAAALALVATALLAAAPPATSPQADAAAIAKIVAAPAAPALPSPVQASAPPRDWTPAVCVPMAQDCCHRVPTGGGCWYCADEEPGVC